MGAEDLRTDVTFQTTFGVPQEERNLAVFADHMRDAVQSAITDSPQIHAYFVHLLTSGRGVQVGFKLGDIELEEVRTFTDRMLDQTIDNLVTAGHVYVPQNMHRQETVLRIAE